jgi:hypothetical protein
MNLQDIIIREIAGHRNTSISWEAEIGGSLSEASLGQRLKTLSETN